MMRLIKLFFQFLSIAAFLTVVYSNIIVIPKGYIGILKDKIEGYQTPSLKFGYHWVWTMFVPQKYKLIIFREKLHSLSISYSNKLKFTDYLNLSKNYYVHLKINLDYSLNEEAAYQLLPKFEDDINKISEYIEKKVLFLIDSKYSEFYKKENDIPFLHKKFTNYFLLEDKNQNTFQKDWDIIFSKEKIALENVEIEKIYIPNYEVYKLQTNHVKQISQARRKALTNQIIAESLLYKTKLKNKAELNKSIQYSKLIQENPKLIDYLKIEKLNPKAKIIIITDPKYSNEFINSTSSNDTYKKNKNKTTSEEGYISPIQPIEK